MECKEIKNNIIPFISNELESSIMVGMKTHIDECEDCQSLYSFTKNSLLSIKKEIRTESDSKFYTSIKAKLEVKPQAKKIKFTQQFIKYGVAAMLSIISIVGGSYIGSYGAEIINDSALNNNTTQYEIMDIANNDIDLFKDL